MKAIIKLDVPEWQIGEEVFVYFPDTMCKKAICELDTSAISAVHEEYNLDELAFIKNCNEMMNFCRKYYNAGASKGNCKSDCPFIKVCEKYEPHDFYAFIRDIATLKAVENFEER